MLFWLVAVVFCCFFSAVQADGVSVFRALNYLPVAPTKLLNMGEIQLL